MKIKISNDNCIVFFQEMVEEYADAACYYGHVMAGKYGDSTYEERAAKEYETAWVKVQEAMQIIFYRKKAGG